MKIIAGTLKSQKQTLSESCPMKLIVSELPFMNTRDVTEDKRGAVYVRKGCMHQCEPSIVGLWLLSTLTADLEPQMLGAPFQLRGQNQGTV